MKCAFVFGKEVSYVVLGPYGSEKLINFPLALKGLKSRLRGAITPITSARPLTCPASDHQTSDTLSEPTNMKLCS